MRSTFFCIDGHTAGNPVRLVVGGAPPVRGATMGECRLDFLERFDWIRTSLCFEPRGHDQMSGGFLYPPFTPDADIALLFMETSGCLPMCGHGTIGMISFGLEHGYIQPRTPGRLRVEVPAGIIDVSYTMAGARVASVRLSNVPSYVAARDISIEVPGLGPLTVDVAYGGNYYTIVEPQGGYTGLDGMSAPHLVELSRVVRALVREKFKPVHPLDPAIHGVSHVLWTDLPSGEGADARNAVFYGEKAIDRSPCGTGTSARMAHLHGKGLLALGQRFIHESYIGSRFVGRIEGEARVGDFPAILPSIEGSAISTGFNTIWVDRDDPYWEGFQLT
ncbi:hydroxyproline-2-epimerase [Pacificimonas flava]|uniref:Hydroxyproline-2-epimerase n=2 Tax=Pacificimonas TaxID=1960290 RepID=A0A219B369_9SPHN|nr:MULTISPECIES: 4-hydroxyproline epimerase [Pacificimonas]MBZ6377708.1 4-hydroxyproline epimerase [Pacificimonas aurantium]OWV32614.1 hydroxyproline-2-epimerase [Pacificimonas flava]